MTNFNDNTISEAAYYIWKNNGCPANSSAHDWNSAINQLSSLSALASAKGTAKKASAKSAVATLSAAKAAASVKSDAAKKMPQIVLTSKKKSK